MSFYDVSHGLESKSANNSSSSSSSTTITVLRSTLLFLIVLTIIVTNIINIFIIIKLRELQIVGKVLFINLSIAGLLNGAIVCIPGFITSMKNFWFLGDAYCQFSSIVNGSCSSVTIWTLAAISMDRYMAIQHPISYRSSAKFWLILIIIASFWLAGIITFTAPLFVKKDYYEYQSSVFICSMFWKSTAFCIITGLYIPILSAFIIFWSSYKITKCLKGIIKTKINRRYSMGTFRTMKTMRIIIIHAITYFTAWAPYTIGVYLVSFGTIKKIPEYMDFVITWLANCSCFMNVFIYSINSEEYRRRLRNSLNFFKSLSLNQGSDQQLENNIATISRVKN